MNKEDVFTCEGTSTQTIQESCLKKLPRINTRNAVNDWNKLPTHLVQAKSTSLINVVLSFYSLVG